MFYEPSEPVPIRFRDWDVEQYIVKPEDLVYPHVVTLEIEKDMNNQYKEISAFIGQQGVAFNDYKLDIVCHNVEKMWRPEELAMIRIHFKDPKVAMAVKLKWGRR